MAHDGRDRDGLMGIRESGEVSNERILRRDHGPDLAVILPREMWILVGALIEFSHTAMGGPFDDGVDAVLFEMADFSLFTINRAVKDSMLADTREAFGG